MDALSGLLDGPRAQGAFLLKALLGPPWSMQIADDAPLTVFAVLCGEAWLAHADTEGQQHLRAGDTAVVRAGGTYQLADRPDRPPTVFVGPDGNCRDGAGRYLMEAMRLGVRTWGNDPAGQTTLLIGTYGEAGEIGSRLLRALPPVLVLPAVEWDSPLVSLLADELERDAPGEEAVLDRLLDLLLITALRAWFSRSEARAPAWFAASADPVVGRALRLLHHNPASAWTVASLAGQTGVSRAALARRFTDLVGEPPMAYLTGWRLALAADLLRDPDRTLASVARQVGYASPFALSAAFKRVRGMSPREHRSAAS